MAEAIQIAGTVVKGVAGYEAGKYNKKVAYTEALNAERDGAAEEARIREGARMAMGEQIAAQGSNGFQIGTGSALDALHQSAVNATLDALTARRQAQAKARSARSQGDIAKAQGNNALIQSLIGAGSQGVDWASSKKAAG